MSRRVQQPIQVESETGSNIGSGVSSDIDGAGIAPVPAPSVLRLADGRVLPVAGVMDYFREWLGVLEGEGERDVWWLDTPAGLCEVHHLRPSGSADAPAVPAVPAVPNEEIKEKPQERMENYNIKEGEERGIRFDTWLLHAWLD